MRTNLPSLPLPLDAQPTPLFWVWVNLDPPHFLFPHPTIPTPIPFIGLWTKDMKMRTNLPQPHITKILKTLENRKLVKSVKSVSNPGRKVFMLFELEPSRELTGGAWWVMGGGG